MTHSSRTLAATLMLALILGSFSSGWIPVRADDAGTASSTVTDSSDSQAADSTDTSVSSDTSGTPAAETATDTQNTSNTQNTWTISDTTDTSDAGDTEVASDTPATSDQGVTASSTPEQSGQAAEEDTADASSTLPAISALLTGSSTASSTVGDLASTTSTSATTTTATSTGPAIQSGQAVALANILNIVNTNLVNSSGDALLLNYVAPVTGPIDLRTGTPVFASSSPICALIACAGTGGVSVNMSSDAGIHNAVVLNATSGGNLIDMGSTTGSASIGTGDAFAGLNLINLANTNIVDSNYLLVTMNAFQGVSGDIIFPSLTNLLSSLAHTLSPGSLSVTSQGNVSNNVSTDAQTGGNSIENASSSQISTGSSASTGSVFNQINTNMFGGSSVAILFRIQGNWAGQVYGAPPGLQWAQGADGTLALFDSDANGSSGASSLSQLTASSSARIDNDVNVMALTGDNLIKNANSALITTGNALASANVINVANTNVVGKNWIMAIVNIFGDFTGNISFGRPDLWVGEQVSVPSFVSNGSQATYKFTVINNGDAPASNVTLKDAFDAAHISVGSASLPYTSDDGSLSWDLGTIPPGGAVEVTYQGTVQNTSPGTNVTDTVQVAGTEPDNNMADNTDTATFSASRPASHGGGSIRAGSLDDLGLSPLTATTTDTTTASTTATAHLTVNRAVVSAVSHNGAPVHQTVTVANDSSIASIPIVVHDILTAPDGSQVYDESWDVGSLAGGDAVQLAYDASFAPEAPAGTYTLSTVIDDEQGNELGYFVGNGSIAVTKAAASASRRLLTPLSAFALTGEDMAGSASVLDSVIPGIPIAHAAGAHDQAAAAGFISVSWPYLLAVVLVLLGLLALLAWYRRREEVS